MGRTSAGTGWTTAGACLALAFSLAAGAAPAAPPARVPSPDWRDQVIYFAMIDRFDDGDPRNDDQHAGEYDPADGAKFSGGDLAGLARRVGYLRGLGATTLWITPPVANRWWDPTVNYGGYHGYWAEDFGRVDAHFGTLADYRRLADILHAAGMYLVQDVVVNHTGNFFRYDGGRDPRDPAAHFALVPDARGRTAPTQPPFDRNDPRKPGDRAAAIYHWTPPITDYGDERQRLDFQLADLDDLNTENPAVRDALRASYGMWVREVGVDAFRIDTAAYVPPAFFRDFLYSRDPRHPGIAEVARRAGRQDFLAFGEGFLLDKAYGDSSSKRIDAYMHDAHGRLLPSMLDFPLYGTLGDVFARGRPTAELGWRIADRMRVYARPWLMPTFVDNHDVERFLAGAGEPALKQALLALMTLPGIPVIYAGTEQGFTGQRDSMFKGGFGSRGADHFDPQAPLYHYLQRAIALRRGDRVFSRGTPTVLREDAAGPGVLAYRMQDGGQRAYVAFNTADRPALLDNLATGLPAGRVLHGVFAIEGAPADVVVGAGGRVDLVLPPHAGLAWRAIAPSRARSQSRSRPAVRLDALADERVGGDFVVQGTARGTGQVQVVVDGDLAGARHVPVDARGHWRATVDTGAMADADVAHRVVAWPGPGGAASAARSFHVARPWSVLAEVDDPTGDDHGPRGRYTYPTGLGWNDAHPLDIEHVRVSGAGGALRVEFTMHGLQEAWNPPNGFDHVAFMVYLQVPGMREGASVMPLQNADVPAGLRWNLRLRVDGFSNALFAAAGASATSEGTPVSPAAAIRVDKGRRTIAFTLPASVLGKPASLSGVKLYATTWDMGEGPRPLRAEAGPWAFGGGDGTRDPLVMDDSAVVTLP
ncbi:MAG TPA: alpha-amylase family glycosyl hydrolase [Xanthomonadaceae bacterium]|nr:alpha-amylase family glycosyl hydrolase [Xanthomonadaceae bacterium]